MFGSEWEETDRLTDRHTKVSIISTDIQTKVVIFLDNRQETVSW